MNTDGFINITMRLQAVVCAWKEHVTNNATREEFQLAGKHRDIWYHM